MYKTLRTLPWVTTVGVSYYRHARALAFESLDRNHGSNVHVINYNDHVNRHWAWARRGESSDEAQVFTNEHSSSR